MKILDLWYFTPTNARKEHRQSEIDRYLANPKWKSRYLIEPDKSQIANSNLAPHFWKPDFEKNAILPMNLQEIQIRKADIDRLGFINRIDWDESGQEISAMPEESPVYRKFPWQRLVIASAIIIAIILIRKFFNF